VSGIDPSPADLDAPIAMFGYNPSAWSQRAPICVLAIVAFLLAAHMALFQWGLIADVWDPVFGDQTKRVLQSNVARQLDRWFRAPDAAIGALAYLGDAIFGFAGSTRRWQYRPWMVILFGIDVIPLGIVSAVLVVLQGAVVGSWCFPCLLTAVISLVLVYYAYDEVWTSLVFLYRVGRETRSRTAVWDALWGVPSVAGERVAHAMIAYKAVSSDARSGSREERGS